MFSSDEKLSIMEIKWALDKLVLYKIIFSSINTLSEEYNWMKLRVGKSHKEKLG